MLNRIFISADIEGTCGICHWDETELGKGEYEPFRHQMTAEVAAACEGANAAGAKEIFVKDAHDSARNINPELLLSALTDDCVSRGKDIVQGGARYNHKTFSLVGFGTLCDSLLALRQAFEDGTERQLMDGCLSNFKNDEALRVRLQSDTLRFGHSDDADAFARQLALEWGCTVIRMDTHVANTPAQQLYLKHGYRISGRSEVLLNGQILQDLYFLELKL